MSGLELVVVLGAALVACTLVARRLRIASAVLLLVCGILLGLLPALHDVGLPPEIVLFIFLPALLFWESLTTSLRGIRRDLRGIVLTSTLLVFLSAGAVALVTHAFGVSWGVAWVIGAALAPTDATAVAAFARSLPRRNMTLLKAESLVNDGTALVVYGIAVGVVVSGERPSLLGVTWDFALSYLGGGAAGALVAALGLLALRYIREPLLKNVTLILMPFVGYLAAELIHASGVLAVVVAGLVTTQVGPRVSTAASRSQGDSFWSLATFMLNGALFVLIGLEVSNDVRRVPASELGRALGMIVVAWLTLLAVRFAFHFLAGALVRLTMRSAEERARHLDARARVVASVAGLRGAVSLAAALAVPTTVASGADFPERHVVIFVTAGVIVLALVVQGLILPPLVQWARFAVDAEEEDERRLAETTAIEEALAAVPQVADELEVDEDVRERVADELEAQLAELRASLGEADDDQATLSRGDQYRALRLALLDRKREAVLALRDRGEIDDLVLRRVQSVMDVEEARLLRPEPEG
jgi:Na+/H+ antiporter